MAGRNHYSHTTFGGIPLTFGKRGIVFTKKPSKFNNCIGDKLRGGSLAGRAAAKSAFTAAVSSCQ